MQIVLSLADRTEQAAAQRLLHYREQVNAEQQQLHQLEQYTEQYLHTYAERKSGLYAQELISYSSFIQRLDEARQEQQLKLGRMLQTLEQIQLDWREKHQRRKSIQELIARLQHQENDELEKSLQKELDELSTQQYRGSS